MNQQGPLQGVRILDLTRVLAGPWCTQLFGDMGAEVIKIERPAGGDETRQWGPPFFEGQSAYFLCANRNKTSLTVDLKTSEGQEQIKKMVPHFDVIVENFKPGPLESWGLDYESVEKINPQLVYCSIRGFSSQGPYKDRPGYDALIQAMSGMMSITGEENGKPIRVGSAIADLLTGLYGGNAILAALWERVHSQQGQHIEVSLFETQVACLANVLLGYLVSGECPQPYGTAHPQIVPYQAFETQDKMIFIAVGNDQQFQDFCQRLQVEWHQDKRFNTNPQRVQNREKLVDLIQKTLKNKTQRQWLKLFETALFPNGPVNNFDDLKKDPHVRATGLLGTMEDSSVPRVKNPIQFSRTPIVQYRSPPLFADLEKGDRSCS